VRLLFSIVGLIWDLVTTDACFLLVVEKKARLPFFYLGLVVSLTLHFTGKLKLLAKLPKNSLIQLNNSKLVRKIG